MKVTICIGSSCHLKGSKVIVDDIQKMVTDNNLEDKVDIGGTFCLGNCQQGVSVQIGDDIHSVSPETTAEFFEKEILSKV